MPTEGRHLWEAGVNRIGEQCYCVIDSYMGCVCKQLIKDHVPSERERGLDALSVSERPYHRPNNNCFVKSEEQGLVPLFRVYGFGIDEFVKFKNRPFSGRFEG